MFLGQLFIFSVGSVYIFKQFLELLVIIHERLKFKASLFYSIAQVPKMFYSTVLCK